jgi:3-methyladenine DNA glycosylase AlkC
MDKLNNEEKMKKDFDTEKAQLIKDWQKKCEETSLAVRNQEKEAAKQQLSKVIADYNGRIEAMEKTISELKESVIEHRSVITTKD